MIHYCRQRFNNVRNWSLNKRDLCLIRGVLGWRSSVNLLSYPGKGWWLGLWEWSHFNHLIIAWVELFLRIAALEEASIHTEETKVRRSTSLSLWCYLNCLLCRCQYVAFYYVLLVSMNLFGYVAHGSRPCYRWKKFGMNFTYIFCGKEKFGTTYSHIRK